MQLYQIRYFLAIHETGGVSAAARLCNVSQPSISRGLKILEDELGGSLLVRHANGVRLTPFGEDMLPYFQNLLEGERELMDHARSRQDAREARVRMGLMCTLGTLSLQPWLSRLMGAARAARIDLVDGSGPALHQMMEDGALDMCVSGFFHTPSNVVSYPLYDERYVISFPKGHPFEKQEAVSIADLKDMGYVRRLECELGTTLKDMLDSGPEPEVDVRFESVHENIVQMAVLSGLGCCIHPETMPVQDGILQRPFTEAAMSRRVRLMVARAGAETPLVRRIVRQTQAHFTEAQAKGVAVQVA